MKYLLAFACFALIAAAHAQDAVQQTEDLAGAEQRYGGYRGGGHHYGGGNRHGGHYGGYGGYRGRRDVEGVVEVADQMPTVQYLSQQTEDLVGAEQRYGRPSYGGGHRPTGHYGGYGGYRGRRDVQNVAEMADQMPIVQDISQQTEDLVGAEQRYGGHYGGGYGGYGNRHGGYGGYGGYGGGYGGHYYG